MMNMFHEIAIAEAGEDKNSIREAYIINEIFFNVCKQPQVASRHALSGCALLQILLSTFAVTESSRLKSNSGF